MASHPMYPPGYSAFESVGERSISDLKSTVVSQSRQDRLSVDYERRWRWISAVGEGSLYLKAWLQPNNLCENKSVLGRIVL